uniref:Uncharacterized protein n=1 Tax=viral metagenome TaxID=1070528 RepID=A0A6M3LKD3_9ZZZZ
MTTSTNGSWKTWVITALYMLVISLGAYAFTSVSNYITRVDDQALARDTVTVTQQNNNRERLSRLEAQFESIQKDLEGIKQIQREILQEVKRQ